MPRLPKGIFKRGSSYYIKAKIRGKGVWKSLGPDREEAVKRYRQIQTAGGLRTVVQSPGIASTDMEGETTVQQVGRRWLSEYVATRRNEKGRQLAEARFRTYLAPALGTLGVGDVRPDHLRQLRLELERHSLSPQSVAHILSDARCFFGYVADELRLIPRSPFPPRLLPRIQEIVTQRHSRKEILVILDSVSDEHAFVVSLALGTGLRWSEVRRLRWKDIHWSEGRLVVEQTKSAKVRRVPIPETLQSALRARFSRSSSLYVSPFRCESSGAFNRAVRRMSGVRDFRFHRLRHTFACDWLEGGGSKEALQVILGHSTIRLTERYGKVSDDFVELEAKGVAEGVAAKYRHAVSSLNSRGQHAVNQ